MKPFYVKKVKNLKNKHIKTQSKLLTSLLQSKSHYGAVRIKTQSDNQKFLYGIRSHQTILNLRYTIQSIKRAFLLIEKMLQLRSIFSHNQETKILVICNSDQTRMFTKSSIFHDSRFEIIHEKWVGGFLTNSSQFNHRLKNINLIVALNTIHENWLITSAATINIPLISVTNTHIKSGSIEYPIFMNTKNIQSTFFLLFLLKKYLTT